MVDLASYMTEAVVSFKLAGIACVATIALLIVFGGVLRLVGLAGVLAAVGFGFTLLQVLLGLQYYAKANEWSQQAMSNLSWGYAGLVLFLLCWFATWAKLQEGR